jgi:hypothetical protein
MAEAAEAVVAATNGIEAVSTTEAVTAVPTPLTSASQFSQISLTVTCARIDSGSGGLLKPNPYVEVIVDGKPPKKTDMAKSTYQPKWDAVITVVVTPFSKILFRLFDHSAFKRDALLGEHAMDLYNVLKKHGGKCKDTTVSVDLFHKWPLLTVTCTSLSRT